MVVCPWKVFLSNEVHPCSFPPEIIQCVDLHFYVVSFSACFECSETYKLQINESWIWNILHQDFRRPLKPKVKHRILGQNLPPSRRKLWVVLSPQRLCIFPHWGPRSKIELLVIFCQQEQCETHVFEICKWFYLTQHERDEFREQTNSRTTATV